MAAGLQKPDLSILSDQFLAEVRGPRYKNVAAELLEKLLKDELKVRAKRNLVQSQLFSEKLKLTLNAYHNRAIATQEVLKELIKLAREMDAAGNRGEYLGLTDDEIAFYDALAANESAVQAMGDDKLKPAYGQLWLTAARGHEKTLASKESCRAERPVHPRQPTFMNEYTTALDRPLPPLALCDISGRCKAVTRHCARI